MGPLSILTVPIWLLIKDLKCFNEWRSFWDLPPMQVRFQMLATCWETPLTITCKSGWGQCELSWAKKVTNSQNPRKWNDPMGRVEAGTRLTILVWRFQGKSYEMPSPASALITSAHRILWLYLKHLYANIYANFYKVKQLRHTVKSIKFIYIAFKYLICVLSRWE